MIVLIISKHLFIKHNIVLFILYYTLHNKKNYANIAAFKIGNLNE